MTPPKNPWDQEWSQFKGLNIFGKIFWYNQRRAISRIFSSLGLKKDCKILDAGCGSGKTLSFFRKMGYNNSFGADISDEALKLCETIGLKIGKDVKKIDLTKTDFKDQSFTVVFSDGVLEHFRDFSPFISEFCRISKRYVILAQPNHFSLFGRLLKKVRKVHEYSYSEKDYVDSMKAFNFKLIKRASYNFGEGMIMVFERIV